MGKKNKLKLDIGTIYQKEEDGIYFSKRTQMCQLIRTTS